LFQDFRDLSALSGAGLRPALLRELADLYVQKPSHTPEEERLFTELALRLIDHVDAAERALLGARLSSYPNAPLAVLRRLAQSDAATRSQPAENEPQSLPRIEEPHLEQTLSETFFSALPAERRLILLHLDYAPIAPATIVPTVDAVVTLERALLRRNKDQFAAALETALSISSGCAQRVAGDSTGEAVIAALKALSVPSPALQRILLFLDPAIGQSSETYFSLVRLYEEIGIHAARRLVAIWRRDDAASPVRIAHRAQLFDDGASRARDFARHDARPAIGKAQPDQTRRIDHNDS
jgi:hypothetical protein